MNNYKLKKKGSRNRADWKKSIKEGKIHTGW